MLGAGRDWGRVSAASPGRAGTLVIGCRTGPVRSLPVRPFTGRVLRAGPGSPARAAPAARHAPAPGPCGRYRPGRLEPPAPRPARRPPAAAMGWSRRRPVPPCQGRPGLRPPGAPAGGGGRAGLRAGLGGAAVLVRSRPSVLGVAVLPPFTGPGSLGSHRPLSPGSAGATCRRGRALSREGSPARPGVRPAAPPALEPLRRTGIPWARAPGLCPPPHSGLCPRSPARAVQ